MAEPACCACSGAACLKAPMPTGCHSKTPIVHRSKRPRLPSARGFFVVRYQCQCRGRFRPPPDGLPRIRDRDRVDYGAEPGAMDMMLPALPNIASAFHHRRQPAPDGAVGLPARLRCRAVHHGAAVRIVSAAGRSCSAAWRWRRELARDRSPLVPRRCCWRGRCRASAPRPPA